MFLLSWTPFEPEAEFPLTRCRPHQFRQAGKEKEHSETNGKCMLFTRDTRGHLADVRAGGCQS